MTLMIMLMYSEKRVMLKLGRRARGHFVTLIEICVHLIRVTCHFEMCTVVHTQSLRSNNSGSFSRWLQRGQCYKSHCCESAKVIQSPHPWLKIGNKC